MPAPINLPLRWLVLFALLTPAARLPAETSPKSWPRVYFVEDVPIKTVRADPSASEWVYQTENYEVYSQQNLTPNQTAEIGRVLESVVGVLGSAPYPILDAAKRHGRNRVLLYASPDAFRRQGLPGNAAGFYDPRTGHVSILIPYLFQPAHARDKLPPRQRYKVLVHELVHQAMHGLIDKIPPWLVEGTAEFLSSVHDLPPGRYDFSRTGISLKSHLTQNLGIRGNRARLPSPDIIFNVSPNTWFEDNLRGGADGYHKYATSALLAHFFFLDRSRAPAMDSYFSGIQKARRIRSVNDAAAHTLLHGTSLPEIESKMVKYWASQGFEIVFD